MYKLNKIVVAVLLSSFCGICSAYNNKPVSDEEYALMPPVFHLDDFDECLLLKDHPLYCSIEFRVKPKGPANESHIWTIIEKTKKLARFYDHDRLRYGVCVPQTCPNISKELYSTGEWNPELRDELSKCFREKLAHLDLSGSVVTLHCENENGYYPIETYDIIVAIFVMSLLALTIFASFYEGLARYKTQKEYEEITGTPFGKLISCFSAPKNYYRLTRNVSAGAENLRCIQGLRFYTMFCIIMSHTLVLAFAGPVYNTKYGEEMTQKPANTIVSNGLFITQTFFTISGWLLSYHFFLMIEGKREVKFSYILLAFINRYVRLTPLLLIVIALSGTWVAHIYRGPVWHKLVGLDYEYCRENGWVNLLYLNNYYNKYRVCLQHTWYLAADTQLFTISLVVLMLVWKFPNHTKKIFGFMMFLSVVIPSTVNYIYNVDIIMRVYPEIIYVIFANIEHYFLVHTSLQANLGGYIVGLIGGYLFYKYRGKNIFENNRHYVTLWWILLVTVPLVIILSGYVMYDDNYKGSRIISALYSGFARPIYAAVISLAIFGASQRQGWFVLSMIEWSPTQVLGRLTYSAYLVHATVCRLRGGYNRQPMYVADYVLLTQTISDVTLSYLLAFVFCIFAEMPMTALQKLYVPNLEGKRQANLDEKSQQRVVQTNGDTATSRI